METIQIEFQPNVRQKLMDFLNTFNSSEIKIKPFDAHFEANKKILVQRLEELRNGKSELIPIEEYELTLEN
jgi:hypothetical protein